jgi:hypothetical protein
MEKPANVMIFNWETTESVFHDAILCQWATVAFGVSFWKKGRPNQTVSVPQAIPP